MSDIYEQKCSRQVVLDTETTGKSDDGSPGDHRIVEIGCVEVINRKVTGNKLQLYLNPERKVDEEAFAVHGISDEFLANQPKFHEVFQQFYDFIYGSELLIHNAKFDVGFINNEFKLDNRDLEVESICKVTDTLDIAKKKYPGQKVSLDALCSKLNVDKSARTSHGALLDSEILAEVFLAMTGGQTDFGFEESSTVEIGSKEKIDRDILLSGSSLPMVEITPQEEFEHAMYMIKMGEQRGIEEIFFGNEFILPKMEVNGKEVLTEGQKITFIRTSIIDEKGYEEYQSVREELLLDELDKK